MTAVLTCPTCEARVRVSESRAGQKARCPRCEAIFLVPDLNEPAEEAPPPARPAPRPRPDYEDDRPYRPRRRPRRKSGSEFPAALVAVLVLVGGLFAAGGVGAWVLLRAKPVTTPVQQSAAAPTTVAAPAATTPAPPAAGGGGGAAEGAFDEAGNVAEPGANRPVERPQGPPPGVGVGPAGVDPGTVELSNPKLEGFGLQMRITVDYRFTNGAPTLAAGRYVLYIKPSRGFNIYYVEMNPGELKADGQITASGFASGGDKFHAPFEVYLVLEPPGIGPRGQRSGKTVSNTLTVDHVDLNPGVGRPGMPGPIGPRPPIGPIGPRGPFGPRGPGGRG
jgi:hypothetical protein